MLSKAHKPVKLSLSGKKVPGGGGRGVGLRDALGSVAPLAGGGGGGGGGLGLERGGKLCRRRFGARALEAEAKAQSTEVPRDDEDEPPTAGASGLPTHRIPAESDGTPKGKAQRNFTDSDSRIMKTGDGFIQGYNAQCVVDDAAQVIVAQAVTNQAPDAEHFMPLLEQAMRNCGERPRATSADAGYCSERNIEWALNQGLGPHIASGRTKHDAEPAMAKGRPPKSQTLKQWMARLLGTQRGKKIYSRRKVIAEPPFGQMKNRGFRQFLLRGTEKVRGEWSLITTSHKCSSCMSRRAGEGYSYFT